MMISTEKKLTPDNIIPKEKINLLIGDQVYSTIQEEHFQMEWDSLYQKCSWSTVFQNRNFVTHWYQIYKDEFIPIMVTLFKGQRLVGLLTMSIFSQKEGTAPKQYRGKIVGAGHYEAEYQSWLSTEEHNDKFIHQALTLITHNFPHCHIFFRYLIPQVPLGWIDDFPIWKKKTVMQDYKRPIMRMDDPEISKLFRKKEFRNKYNRLKRFGKLSFEKISDPKEFDQVLPVLIEQFEFRQRAMFNKSQFTDSPEKLDFLKALFEHGLLHATILKVDNDIVASILGLLENHWYHLGAINTHSPIYGNHSPGFVHFILLGELLSQNSQNIFDLTPGGDAYKERMATSHDYVIELCIAGSPLFDKKQRLKYLFHEYLMKWNFRPMSMQLAIKKRKYNLKHRIKKLRTNGLKAFISNGGPVIDKKDETLYPFPLPTGIDQILVPVNENNLGDLLDYEEDQYGRSPWDFLEDAMVKYADEFHSFTWADNGVLLGCAWICNGDRWTKLYGIPFPGKPHPVVIDIYYHPQIKDRVGDFISAVIIKVLSQKKHTKIYICSHPQKKGVHQWVSQQCH